MSKTKSLVIALSVLTSLAGIGVSTGTAQAQNRSDRASIAVGEVNRTLDRAEYTSFRGFGGYGFKRSYGFKHFDRFYGFKRFDRSYGFKRFNRFDRFGRGGRGFGWGRF